jgi:hypothetical protein
MSVSLTQSVVSLPQSPFPPLAVGFMGLGTGYLIYGTQEFFGYPARDDRGILAHVSRVRRGAEFRTQVHAAALRPQDRRDLATEVTKCLTRGPAACRQ